MAPSVEELHAAARAGKVDEVRQALASGADVESPDPKNQQTLLHAAALSGQLEVAQLLLDAGADANTAASLVHAPTGLTVTGATPLHFAAATAHSAGHLATLKLLLSRGASVLNVTGAFCDHRLLAAC